jgi:hypothetical protein
MVDETSEPLGLQADTRTFLNHHFRHIFEYTWPLYPWLIVLSPLVGIPIRTIALYNLPLTGAAIAGGLIFGLAWVKTPKGLRQRGGGLLDVIEALWPILLIVALVMLFNLDLLICLFLLLLMLLSRIKPWLGFAIALLVNGVLRLWMATGDGEMPVYIGNAAVALILIVFILVRPLYPWREFISLLRRAIKPYMVVMVFGVMVFSSMIEASGAAIGVAADIERIGLPPIFIICLLPALLGYLTGITHSFVAGSFPILLPFIPEGNEGLPYISLAYACGFIGVLISPVHFCLILTVDYFKSDLMRVVWMMLPPAGVVFAVALLRYFLS